MLTSKTSSLNRFLAVLLAVLMLVSTFPLALFAAFAEDDNVPELLGHVEVVTSASGATVSGDKSAETNVDYTSDYTLNWVAADPSAYRYSDGWWVGINMYAPEGYGEEALKDAKYQTAVSGQWPADTDKKYFWSNKDSSADPHYIGLWGLINETLVYDAISLGKDKLVYQWRFDWNNDNTYEQVVTLNINLKTLTLVKGKEVIYPSDAADKGTVTPIVPVSTTVEKNGQSIVDIKVSSGELQWSPVDEAAGRNSEGWWFGIKATAPDGFSADAKYRTFDGSTQKWGTTKKFASFKDGEDWIGLWGILNPDILNNAKANNKNITYKWQFDWNGDGDYEQIIIVSVDPSELVLMKDNIQMYPGLGTVSSISGASKIDDNGTGLVTVSYDTNVSLNWAPFGNWGRVPGWWAGIKMTAPDDISIEELKNAKYQTAEAGEWPVTVKEFWKNKDSSETADVHYIELWGRFDQDILDVAIDDSENVVYKWHFDWNGDGVYEQEVVYSVDPSKVELVKVTPTLSFNDNNPVDLWSGNLAYTNTASSTNSDGEITYCAIGKNAVYVKEIDSDGKVVFDLDKLALIDGPVSIEVEATIAETAIFESLSKSYTVTIYKKEQGVDPAFKFERTEDANVTYGENNNTFENVAVNGKGQGALSYTIISAITLDKKPLSASDIAVVDANGKITFKRSGIIKVQATKATDGEYKAASVTYTLTVNRSEQEVSFGELQSDTITFGQTASHAATAKGEITYSSSDEEIATVDSNGVVTALKAGTVTITATAAENECYLANETGASYTLTIKHAPRTVTFGKGNNVTVKFNDNGNNFENIASVTEGSTDHKYSVVSVSSATIITVADDFEKSGKFTVNGAGEVVIGVKFEIDDCYDVAYDEYKLTITKDIQSIKFDDDGPASLKYGVTEYTNIAQGVQVDSKADNGYGTGAIKYSITGSNPLNAAIDPDTGKLTFVTGKTGQITIRADKTETEESGYASTYKEYTLEITYEDTPDKPYTVKEEKNANGWYKTSIHINAPGGYLVSYSNEIGSKNVWTSDVSYDTEGVSNAAIYLRNNETGAITDAIEINDIRIDTINPSASIEADGLTPWEKFLTIVTFGIWDKDTVDLTVDYSDENSEIDEADVKYYVLDGAVAMDKATLDALADSDDYSVWTVGSEISIPKDKVVTVYAKVADKAGNYVYASTNGIVFDATAPTATLTVKTEAQDDEYYNGDVEIIIEASDAAQYSGLNNIRYDVVKDGDMENPTQQGFINFAEENPKYDDLKQSWNSDKVGKNIIVKADLNNSDDIVVYLTVTDNAGNVYKTEKHIKISTTKPEISVTYSDDPKIVNTENDVNYFRASRLATISVFGRGTAFNPEKSIITITAKDCAGNDIKDAYSIISNWAQSVENPDEYKAVIMFRKEADYTLKVTSTDNANNSAEAYTEHFVIDNTGPSIPEVKINKTALGSVLEVLTFGFYDADLEVTVTSSDAIAGIKQIEYQYVGTKGKDNVTVVDVHKIVPTDDGKIVFPIPAEYRGNLIVTAYDYSMNTATNEEHADNEGSKFTGMIIDTIAPDRTVTFSEADRVIDEITKLDRETYEYKGEQTGAILYYKDTATATIEIVENNFYESDVVVLDNGTAANLSAWTHDGNKHTATVTIAEEGDHVITMTYTDRSENKMVKYESQKIVIDRTDPVISQSAFIDGVVQNTVGNRKYYKTAQTVTFTITEHNFRADDVNVIVTSTETNPSEEAVANFNAYAKVRENWKEIAPDVYQLTLTFDKDANYTLAVEYTDLATRREATPYVKDEFTVDKTHPTGTVKIDKFDNVWEELIHTLTFGLWSKETVTVTGTTNDITSPIKSVDYYKTSQTTALKSEDLDKLAENEWTMFTKFEINPDEQFAVYIRIVDMANNVWYISTDGVIVDEVAPIFESNAPEVHFTLPDTINGFYIGDVTVGIKVIDPKKSDSEDAYSGLKEISYEVLSLGVVTQERKVLFSFDKIRPTHNELVQEWSDDIVIDSIANNSNEVEIRVYAVDNAGNEYVDGSKHYASERIKIDITDPEITVTYDNNNGDTTFADGAFFKSNRTATIAVKERNFDPEKVVIALVNEHGVVPTLSGWSTKVGVQANGDDTTHTATLGYDADGDYTFDISCKDMCERSCDSGEVDYGTSVAPKMFTVDKTVPTFTVYYDNNDSLNGNYYKEQRIATITVTEHNFETSRVNIKLTATDDGKQIQLPAVSNWISKGDVHTATIIYAADAHYTFDFDYTDKAGNTSADIAEQTFYVDKTAPALSITGVENQSANNGDVIPVINYSDTNYDAENVTITLTGANRKEVKPDGNYANQHNGRIFTFNNFAKEKGVDDIYTLTATLTDKAGNTSTETIVFSVNRFGSTYALEASTEKLNNSYVKEPIDVHVSEINVNELKNIKVTLLKNDQTLTLKDGEDYKIDVIGGNGQWYQYTYNVFAENFADDGVYKLVIRSEDTAGNIAENILETKNKEIEFGIDSTDPTIVIANLESGKTYAVEGMTVQMIVKDNLRLAEVIVELDGKEIKSWSAAELNEIVDNGGYFTFDISGDSTSSHNLVVYAVDAAGNGKKISNTELPANAETISDFFVTTNLWVRYYTNKPLFFGSIGGVIGVSALVIFLIVFMKKRKNQN